MGNIFIHSFIHPFYKHLLASYYGQSIAPDVGNTKGMTPVLSSEKLIFKEGGHRLNKALLLDVGMEKKEKSTLTWFSQRTIATQEDERF